MHGRLRRKKAEDAAAARRAPRPMIFLWITLKILLFNFGLDLWKRFLWKRFAKASSSKACQARGASMNQQHITERVVSRAYWPRARELPKCEACGDLMVAPEASGLRPDGSVYYLWSCDCCGQSLVTWHADSRGKTYGET